MQGLGAYATVLREPGALAFSLVGVVARLPISMLGIGIVLLVERETGSYGVAGAVSAVAIIGAAAGGPVQARLADRIGQARLLVPTVLIHGVALTAFIVLTLNDAPPVVLGVLTTIAGATLPQIGAMVRARWAGITSGSMRLHTAYSLESVFDEVVFVVGPVLVTVLTIGPVPAAGLGLAMLLSVGGGLAFAALRSTQPVPQRARDDEGRRDRLPIETLAPLVLAFVFMGGMFGCVEVATVAFSEEDGRPAMAGWLLASFAFGSLVSGVVFGAIRRLRGTANVRFLIGMAILTVALSPLPLIESPAVLAVVVFVAGFAISPTLITGNTLVERGVPPSRLTEGLAWVSTALGAGVALAASVTGVVIDNEGASPAYGVALVSGLFATAIAASRLVLPQTGRDRVRA